MEERRRGERAGVRIDPERLEHALLPGASTGSQDGWSRTEQRAAVDASREVPIVRAESVPLDAEVVVPVAREPETLARPTTAMREPRSGAGTPAGGVSIAAQRPRVLASEALQRELTPSEPAPSALRRAAVLLGMLGAGGVWMLAAGQGMGVPLGAACLGLALLGLPAMPYAARAAAVTSVAAAGLSLVLWANLESSQGMQTVLLMATIILLATGLFLRSVHRASALARALVGCGVALGSLLLWSEGGLAELAMIDAEWQTWLPRWMWVPFGIVLMLALLAFMDARTTAGASAWATLALAWYALRASVELLRLAWPEGASGPDPARLTTPMGLAWFASPILCALLSLGLSQLLASTMAAQTARAAQRPR